MGTWNRLTAVRRRLRVWMKEGKGIKNNKIKYICITHRLREQWDSQRESGWRRVGGGRQRREGERGGKMRDCAWCSVQMRFY